MKRILLKIRLGKTRPEFVYVFLGVLLAVTAQVLGGFTAVAQYDLRAYLNTHAQQPSAEEAHAARTVYPLPIPNVHEVMSGAATQLERELDMRDEVERLIMFEINDWVSIEPVYVDHNLARILIHRGGKKTYRKLLLVHTHDGFDRDRSFHNRLVLDSGSCDYFSQAFSKKGEESNIFAWSYVCKNMFTT